MGGWISIIGDPSVFDHRLAKFKRIFSVEGVPTLRLEIDRDLPETRNIFWAWNNHTIPDVFYVRKDDYLLVLCGAITGLGSFGEILLERRLTTKRILELWIEYNDKVIEQLNGSFSCLFYNRHTKEASIYTDRFSSRSVWYAPEAESWVVGNFPSSIATMLKDNPKIDAAGLWSLFHASRHVGEHGLYHDIKTLLAGQKIVLSEGNGVVRKQWHHRQYEPINTRSAREWGHAIGDALITSSNRYKKVCKNPHLFQSGGLDSRIVAASFGQPLKTLTLCTTQNAESRIATMVSNTIGLEHETVIRSPYWYFDTRSAASLANSGNFFNSHNHFMIPARDICSDVPESEFFLGDMIENINKHYFAMPADGQWTCHPDDIYSVFYKYAQYTIPNVDRMGMHFNIKIAASAKEAYARSLKSHAQSLLGVSSEDADRFDTLLRWSDVSIHPAFMRNCIWPIAGDRNIYFDNEFDKLSLQIPALIRGAGVVHKWILYHLCKRLALIPDANTLLPPMFGNRINKTAKKLRAIAGKFRQGMIHRTSNKPISKTQGSWLLLHELYRKDDRYRGTIEKLIHDESIFPSEIFDQKQIKRTWQEYLNGNTSLHFEIEALLSFGSLNKQIPSNGIEF